MPGGNRAKGALIVAGPQQGLHELRNHVGEIVWRPSWNDHLRLDPIGRIIALDDQPRDGVGTDPFLWVGPIVGALLV